MSFSIKFRLMASFTVIILLAATVGIAGMVKIRTVNGLIQEISGTVIPGIEYARGIDTCTSDIRAAARKHILSPSEEDMKASLEELQAAVEELELHKAEYEKTIKTDEGRNIYNQFASSFSNYLNLTRQAVELSGQGQKEEAGAMLNGSLLPAYSSMQEVTDRLIALKKQRVKEAITESAGQYNSALITVTAAILFAVVSGFILSLLISRNISQGLNRLVAVAGKLADGDLTSDNIEVRGKDEIASLTIAFNKMKNVLEGIIKDMVEISLSLSGAARQLSSQAQQTSAGASENAATVGEIASTVEQVARSAQDVSNSAEEASENADTGVQGIERINTQMGSIVVSSNMASHVLNELSVTLGRINQIVELITHIADQTNLLALNAAIEAARAGEQGRGFAVVAEEVRKLAEQSGGAAKDINQLIDTVQVESKKALDAMDEGNQQVNEGVEVAREVGDSVKDIIHIIDGVAQQIQQVAAAAEQVSAGVQNVSATTEEQTAAMEEVSAASEQLNTLAEKLESIARRFKL